MTHFCYFVFLNFIIFVLHYVLHYELSVVNLCFEDEIQFARTSIVINWYKYCYEICLCL